jgi:uncharacterized lipoprotein YajG
MKKGMALILISFLILLSGCAFGTRKPLLTYSTILSAAPKNDIVVKVHPFKDERTWSKEKIGDVKNGYGMRCADIIPQNDVAEWITDAFKKELTNAGYTVTDDVNTTATIEGVVLEVYVDAWMNYGGRVKLNMVLKKGEKSILDKEYYATKNCGLNWAATAETYGKTIQLTLQDLLSKVIPDINNALLGKASAIK